ncbi:MAG: general secretion pathway protein [Gammaproteobacteria bacterium]|nr:MAG: general secretion pathway protein [Gammaproteobacteria bacterium]
MYLQHYGLTELPFRIVPDTRLFFDGGQRGDVLAGLRYAILSGEGIVKVVGEVGSGKTMLCRMLESRLPDSVDGVYIANPGISADTILNVIAFELGLTEQPLSKLEVMQQLQDYLLQQHARGRRVVVFIEEAQGMPLATLEEIRLLSNLETEQEKLLQIVLFGQPELDDNLARHEIRQLRERITHHFYLCPFDAKAAHAYLNFRTRMAGYKGTDMFSLRQARQMVQASGGLLRRINLLADKTLLACYAAGKTKPTAQHIRMAAADCHFDDVPGQREQRWWPKLALVSVVLAAVLLALYHWLPASRTLPIANAASVTPSAAQPVRRVPVSLPVTQVSYQLAPAASPKPESEPKPEPAAKSTPEPAPLAAAPASPLQARLQQTRQWLAGQPGQQRSIQLISISANRPAMLEQYIEQLAAHPALAADAIFVYASHLQGKAVYSVLYGQYPSRSAARQAMAQLPPFLQQQGPYLVRSVQGIRDEIAATQG